jgi:hypothetical protein
MFETKIIENDKLYLLRLSARILAVACLAILLLFLFGENLVWSKITAAQLLGFLFFPIGLIIGLILAWREELLGGAIAVGCIAAFYLVYGLMLNGTLALGWWFIFFAIPGILFLIYGVVKTPGKSSATDMIND